MITKEIYRLIERLSNALNAEKRMKHQAREITRLLAEIERERVEQRQVFMSILVRQSALYKLIWKNIEPPIDKAEVVGVLMEIERDMESI